MPTFNNTELIVIGVIIVLVAIWFLIKLTKWVLKGLVLVSLLILVVAGGYGYWSGHKSLKQYEGYIKQGQTLALKDSHIWNYLDKSTQKFDFSKNSVQYLKFDKPANILLAPVKVGQVIHFPAVSKKILPYGIDFKIISKKMVNGVLVIGVEEPANHRILTKKELSNMANNTTSPSSNSTAK